MKLLKEQWLNEKSQLHFLDYASDFRERLAKAHEIARENFKESQDKMKDITKTEFSRDDTG